MAIFNQNGFNENVENYRYLTGNILILAVPAGSNEENNTLA